MKILRNIFGNYIAFILWHAYLGGVGTFVMCAVTNSVNWQHIVKPIPGFWIVFIIGCLIGWFHHDKSKEI
jgi:hypothetical protein